MKRRGRKYVINPFVSAAQRRACYAKRAAGEAGSWDCDEWESVTPKGKKLPERKPTSNSRAVLKLRKARLKGKGPRGLSTRSDPTQTLGLVRAMVEGLRIQFAKIKGAIIKHVGQEDALGLNSREIRLVPIQNWDPEQHPRGEHGRFSKGEGEEKSADQSGIGHQGPIKLYHGTSEQAIEKIKKNGLVPRGSAGADEWLLQKTGGRHDLRDYDISPGRRVSVYVTPNPEIAMRFAGLASEHTGSLPAIVKVAIPIDKLGNLKFDENFTHKLDPEGLRYEGKIPPEWIVGTATTAPEMRKLVNMTQHLTYYFVIPCDGQDENSPIQNVFCATGPGGGVDPSCSPTQAQPKLNLPPAESSFEEYTREIAERQGARMQEYVKDNNYDALEKYRPDAGRFTATLKDFKQQLLAAKGQPQELGINPNDEKFGWMDRATKAELHAFLDYTGDPEDPNNLGGVYALVNSYLRGNTKEIDPDVKGLITLMERAFHREKPWKESRDLYRGIPSAISDEKKAQMDRMIDNFKNAMRTGSTVDTRGFMSTSEDEGVAEQFGGKGNGGIFFRIHARKGVNVERVSGHGEGETLLDDHSTFRVLKCEDRTENTYGGRATFHYVELEQVLPPTANAIRWYIANARKLAASQSGLADRMDYADGEFIFQTQNSFCPTGEGWRGDKKHPRAISPKDRPYAVQKSSLLPEKYSEPPTTNSNPNRDELGRFASVPSKPGTEPIPEGHVRLYHYTKGTADSLRESGILFSKARGSTYSEPNMVWGSTQPPDDSHTYVEYHIPASDASHMAEYPDKNADLKEWQKGLHHVGVTRDIKPSEIIAVHEPWHGRYRYIEKNPKVAEDVLKGEHDSLLGDPEYGPAIREYKRKHQTSNLAFNLTNYHNSDVPDWRQPNHYSCGANATGGVIQGKYGLGPKAESGWEKELGTSLKKSTHPFAILAAAIRYGCQYHAQGLVIEPDGTVAIDKSAQIILSEPLTVADLRFLVTSIGPVIVCVQDYGNRREPGASFEYGHYLTVLDILGYDEDGNFVATHILCQDSSKDNVEDPNEGSAEEAGRVSIPVDRWNQIWHDKDGENRRFIHFGIAIGPPIGANVFCATGAGGGVDPSCSPSVTTGETVKTALAKSPLVKKIEDQIEKVGFSDKSYPLAKPEGVWFKYTNGRYQYKFGTSSGGKYTVSALTDQYARENGPGELIPEDMTVAEMEFRNDSGHSHEKMFGIAGTGSAHEVFSKVIPAVAGYIKKKSPDVVTFTADEPSRQRLYDRLVKTVATINPEYKAYAASEGLATGKKYYVIVKRDKAERIKRAYDEYVDEKMLLPQVLVNVSHGLDESWWTPAGWWAPGVYDSIAGSPGTVYWHNGVPSLNENPNHDEHGRFASMEILHTLTRDGDVEVVRNPTIDAIKNMLRNSKFVRGFVDDKSDIYTWAGTEEHSLIKRALDVNGSFGDHFVISRNGQVQPYESKGRRNPKIDEIAKAAGFTINYSSDQERDEHGRFVKWADGESKRITTKRGFVTEVVKNPTAEQTKNYARGTLVGGLAAGNDVYLFDRDGAVHGEIQKEILGDRADIFGPPESEKFMLDKPWFWHSDKTPTVGTYAGLRKSNPAIAKWAKSVGLTANVDPSYEDKDDADKLEQFRKWLDQQIDSNLTNKAADQAWAKYAASGYAKGAGRAFDDAKTKERAKAGADQRMDFYNGSKEDFLRSSFAQPEAVEKIKLLARRSLSEIKNVTDDMRARISRVLVDGLTQGKNPKQIARDMVSEVDISRDRAERIARTEIIRAHAEGQLDSFDRLGIKEVGLQAEWMATDDDRVCPKCEDMDGAVFSTAEARGLIPAHPDCRCAWTTNVG